MNENELEEDFKKMFKATCDFQGNILEAEIANNKKYKQEQTPEEEHLRVLIDSLITRLSQKMLNKIEMESENISYQISLLVSIVRSHYLINNLMTKGHYIEALTLCRKQLENLVRIIELKDKNVSKLRGKSPNISNTLKGFGPFYGKLSEIAHFGKERVSSLLEIVESDEGKIGPSLIPVFNREYITLVQDHHFAIAIVFIGQFNILLEEWYPEYKASENENELIKTHMAIAFKAAVDIGIIKTEE